MTRVVALHGIESTGKSTLAAELARTLGTTSVPEFGREYCLENGTDCTAEDLLNIAETQQTMIDAAKAQGNALVITDTDWLMTRAWHRMMLGEEMKSAAWPTADLYLHLAPDVAWVDDGLRLHAQAAERSRFDALCRAELEMAGARWLTIAGNWDERRASALSAISALVDDRSCNP